ncbi:MAG: hypothetical protein AAFN63_07510 [Pseudomonadota bacterium]
MLNDLDITPNDPEELRAVNRLLADEVKALSLKVEQLQHQLHGHNRHRFGSKSEGLDQLNLTFEEDEAIAEAASEQTQPETPSAEDKPSRQHSRKPGPVPFLCRPRCSFRPFSVRRRPGFSSPMLSGGAADCRSR